MPPSERCIIVVARFPASEVESIVGGGWGWASTPRIRDAPRPWQLGEHLGLYPQAAYEQHRAAAEGLCPPALQRPQLSVVCTADLLAEHDQEAEHGVDLDDLGDDHSLTQDPTVTRIRTAAGLLDEDVRIAVRLPGDYEGADDLDDGAAVHRWTTVVFHPDELGWLREALQPLAREDQDDEDDREPL